MASAEQHAHPPRLRRNRAIGAVRTVLAAGGIALFATNALAFTHAPFVERPIETVQTLALEETGVIVRMLEQDIPVAAVDDLIQRLTDAVLPLVNARLEATDPALATALEQSIADRVEQARLRAASPSGKTEWSDAAPSGGGSDPVPDAASDRTGRLERRLAEARTTFASTEAVGRRAAGGAAAAVLLVSEGGLADAIEDALEGDERGDEDESDDRAELDERSALTIVRAQWLALEPVLGAVFADLGTGDRREVETILKPLRQALARERSAAGPRFSAEDAERSLHAVVARIETAFDADLYPGRDLQRTLGTVQSLTAMACIAAEQPTANMHVAIARWYHEHALEDTLRLFAADTATALEHAFDRFHESEGATDRGAACTTLGAALERVSGLLFPTPQ